MGDGGNGAEDAFGVDAHIIAHVGLAEKGAVDDAKDIVGRAVEAVTAEQEDEIAYEQRGNDIGKALMVDIQCGKGADTVAHTEAH